MGDQEALITLHGAGERECGDCPYADRFVCTLLDESTYSNEGFDLRTTNCLAASAEAARLRRVEEHRDRLLEAARRHVNARNAYLESQNRYRPNFTGAICAAEEAATAAELRAALEEK